MLLTKPVTMCVALCLIFIWLLIRLVNIRIPAEIACLRRNLTDEKMLNTWCRTLAKILVTMLICSALSGMLWGQLSNHSISPFYARSHPSVTRSEEYENYRHILKLNIWRIVYCINCCLSPLNFPLCILPHRHWGVFSNKHDD